MISSHPCQLDRETCISYKNQVKNRPPHALLDSGTEFNGVSHNPVKPLGLKFLHTHWGAAKFDGTLLNTYGMVLATIFVDDKHGHTRWF